MTAPVTPDPYFPTRNLTRTLTTIVRSVDPAWTPGKTKQPEYEFSNGRKFFRNESDRGAYADD